MIWILLLFYLTITYQICISYSYRFACPVNIANVDYKRTLSCSKIHLYSTYPHFLLQCSAGSDSVALVCAFGDLKAEAGSSHILSHANVTVVYFDHRLRAPDICEKERRFVECLATERYAFNFIYFPFHYNQSFIGNVQNTFRQWRHQASIKLLDVLCGHPSSPPAAFQKMYYPLSPHGSALLNHQKLQDLTSVYLPKANEKATFSAAPTLHTPVKYENFPTMGKKTPPLQMNVSGKSYVDSYRLNANETATSTLSKALQWVLHSQLVDTTTVEEVLKQSKGVIVSAHHSSDQMETLLMKLLRGVHIANFKGMHVISPMKNSSEQYCLFRPFLHFSKQFLRECLQAMHQIWCEDESNMDLKYFRNRIRFQLLPALSNVTRHHPNVNKLRSITSDTLETDWQQYHAKTHDNVESVLPPYTASSILEDRIFTLSLQSQLVKEFVSQESSKWEKKYLTNMQYNTKHSHLFHNIPISKNISDSLFPLESWKLLSSKFLQNEILYRWIARMTNDAIHLPFKKLFLLSEKLLKSFKHDEWRYDLSFAYSLVKWGEVVRIVSKENAHPFTVVLQNTKQFNGVTGGYSIEMKRYKPKAPLNEAYERTSDFSKGIVLYNVPPFMHVTLRFPLEHDRFCSPSGQREASLRKFLKHHRFPTILRRFTPILAEANTSNVLAIYPLFVSHRHFRELNEPNISENETIWISIRSKE